MASNGDNDATLLNITLELGGGTEFLTSTKKTKKHSLKVPARVAPNELAKVEPVALAGVIDGSNTKDTTKTAPSATTKHATTMQDFVQFVCRELITERHSMLVEPDGSMRPGILVLINDADWELEGEMEYELQDGDHICFISTLHGG